MASAAHEIARQLKSLFVPRLELMKLERCIVDDFFGDVIDARWNTAVTSSGVAAALQTDPPSRILMDTGGTSGATSELNEGAFSHWTVADRITIRVKSRLSNTANLSHIPIWLDTDTNNRIRIEYTTTSGHTGWVLTTRSGGTTTTSATILAVDTEWHVFDLSLQTGSAKARVDNSTAVENTATIPATNLTFRSIIITLTALSRTSQIDYIMIWPGLAMF